MLKLGACRLLSRDTYGVFLLFRKEIRLRVTDIAEVSPAQWKESYSLVAGHAFYV